MYGSERWGCGFVMARGDSRVMFDLFNQVLDQMPWFVERFVIHAKLFSVGFWRHRRRDSSRFRPLDHARVRVISLVRYQGPSRDAVERNLRAIKITRLCGRRMKAGRVTHSVAGRVDFGARPAA